MFEKRIDVNSSIEEIRRLLNEASTDASRISGNLRKIKYITKQIIKFVKHKIKENPDSGLEKWLDELENLRRAKGLESVVSKFSTVTASLEHLSLKPENS